MILCDICDQKNKFHYTSVFIDNELTTMCDDCRYGKTVKNIKTKEQIFNELQTPFWKMAGQKPKDRDIKLESFLKHKGWSYGDWRKYRDHKLAREHSALPQFNQHYNKYGRNNEPDPSFSKAG